MKRCDKYEDLLARFIHGELLFQEKEDLEGHIAVCSSCERFYRDMTDVDRALRGLPDKLVDPPPYLRTRILANLPEAETAGTFARGWGRWAAALGGALATALLAFLVFRAEPPNEPRVAMLPAPSGGPAAEASRPVAEPPSEEGAVPSGESAAAPAPAPGAVTERPAPPSRIASAPKVQIIREVKIFFYYPPAQKVAVTGDFNGWDPKGVPLTPAGKPGLWETELRLKPGAYSYNFIVDGNVLVPDPNSVNQSPDGFGGTNSILLVKADAV